MGLLGKTARALKWSFFSTYANMGIQFIIGLVLARILMPEDFGILGMTLVFVTVATTFVDSGFLQALIQKKDADIRDFSVVFKFNLVLALLLAMLIFFLAGPIAHYYRQEEVKKITQVLSVLVLIDSLSLVQKAYVMKNLRFELRAKIDLVSIVLSGTLGIFLALKGFGVWSLVVRSLVFSSLVTTLFWIFNPISIKLGVPWKRMRPLLSFGVRIFLADQVESISNQIAQLIIGRKYTAQDLGYYLKASQYQNILSNTAIISVNMVVFPSFSQIQDDNEKLKQAYRSLIKTTLFMLLPFMAMCILIAEEAITIVIGSKWLEVTPYFQLLCVSAIFYPFTVFNLNIIKVKGLASLYFRLALVSKGILVPAIFIGLQFGIIGLVIALLVQRILAALINSRYSGELVGYGMMQQIRDVWPYFLVTGLVFLPLFWFRPFLAGYLSSDLLVVLVLSVSMPLAYLAGVYLVRKSDFLEIITLAKKLRGREA